MPVQERRAAGAKVWKGIGLAWIALTWLVPHAHALDASRVLVIYNANWSYDGDSDGVQDSLQVANYYLQKRGVPAANVLGLPISIGTTYYYSGQDDLFRNEVLVPIKNKLAALGATNIDVLLLCYGMPLSCRDMFGEEVCIDNVLMALNNLSNTSNNISWYTNPYSEVAPSFGADLGHFDHSTYKLNGTDMYLVTRLQGAEGVNSALELVDQARYGERYISPLAGYYNGNGYVDTGNGGGPYTDAQLAADPDVQAGNFYSYSMADKNMAYAEHFIVQSGFPLKWEMGGGVIGGTGALFSDGTSAATAPRALFYGGWYNYGSYRDVWEWLPGSVACDLDSASLEVGDPPGRISFGNEALRHGATCVSGVIGEPYLTGHQRPNVLLYYMLSGYTFAEASALSNPATGWMPINCGDPLYAPMAPKTPVKDTQAPVLSAGYPKTWRNNQTGDTMLSLMVQDTPEPEVATARVEYGLDTNYGFTATSGPGYWRRPTVAAHLLGNKTYHYRVTLTDPVGNSTTSGDYTVTTPVHTPYLGTPVSIPGIVQAENFDNGGDGVAYHDYDPGNNYHVYRDTDVEVGACSDGGGGFAVYAHTDTVEWMVYTINVTASGTYALEARLASLGAGSVFHLEIDRNPWAGTIQVPDTGGWDSWQSVTVSGLHLSAGLHELRLQTDATYPSSGGVGINFLRFSLVKAAASVADFNADGKSDLLLRHPSSGNVYLWLMR